MSFGRLSIVLSTHAAQFEAVAFKGDLEVNLAKIAGWVYQGVELAIRDPALVRVEELKSALARHHLEVPAIGTGQAWGEEHLSFTSPEGSIRKLAVERIKSQIQLARHFNAVVVIGLIRGVSPPGQSKEHSMDYLEDGLRGCAEEARLQGVKLAIEPLNRYETDLIHSAAEGLQLIDQISSPHLGLLLDTFHMNIEEADMQDSIRQAGGTIFHFHVADSNRWYPGAGHLDFRMIIETLKNTGYTGWISGEFLPKPDGDTAARLNFEHLTHLLAV